MLQKLLFFLICHPFHELNYLWSYAGAHISRAKVAAQKLKIHAIFMVC